jgi:hypothetical protein
MNLGIDIHKRYAPLSTPPTELKRVFELRSTETFFDLTVELMIL